MKSEERRAFPGWTADEIHRALNEPATSDGTFEVLHRVGVALGARHGTGPDDDPWLRRQRDEGRAEGLIAAAVAVLGSRGIPVPPDFAGRLAHLAEGLPADLMAAVQTCRSADDLLKRLGG